MVLRKRKDHRPERLRRDYLLPMAVKATIKCDHVDTLERLIEQRYGIEAFYPAISEMFSEPAAQLRVYMVAGKKDMYVAAHDGSLQYGSIGSCRIVDVLGHRDVADRMSRDPHVHDECTELFFRHNEQQQK